MLGFFLYLTLKVCGETFLNCFNLDFNNLTMSLEDAKRTRILGACLAAEGSLMGFLTISRLIHHIRFLSDESKTLKKMKKSPMVLTLTKE